MSSEAMDVRTRMMGQAKERLVDNAAVIISALAVLIVSFSLMLSGVAMYVAFDAINDIEALDKEVRLSEIYIDDLIVVMREHGLEIPEK